MTRRFLVLAMLAGLNTFVSGQTPKPITIEGPVVSKETPHLRVNAGASVATVSSGRQFALVVDVTPARNVHVYAPGKHTYQVVDVAVAFTAPSSPSPPATTTPMTIPATMPATTKAMRVITTT